MKYFLQLISEIVNTNDKFHVIGFSTGGLFAIEVVNILEKSGLKGNVWLLDSSPLLVKTMTTFANEESRQNEFCCTLLRILLPKIAEKEVNEFNVSYYPNRLKMWACIFK